MEARKTPACDWCGAKRPTVATSYGTTNYTRFICARCIDKINAAARGRLGRDAIAADGTLKA